MTHRGRVIATGQADCSFVEWIARRGHVPHAPELEPDARLAVVEHVEHMNARQPDQRPQVAGLAYPEQFLVVAIVSIAIRNRKAATCSPVGAVRALSSSGEIDSRAEPSDGRRELTPP